MRPVFKYIFCILVLAALIFQCFLMFYLVNTYSVSQKNKGQFEWQPYTASYFADTQIAEIHEFGDTQPETPSGVEESPDGSFVTDEPSSETLEPEQEEELSPEEEPVSEYEPMQEVNAFETNSEYEIETENEPELELEDNETTYETESDYSGIYTDNEILYEILVTLKINQYITNFVLAVATVILVFKPIVQSYGNP